MYDGAITLSTNAVRIYADANTLTINGNILGGVVPLYMGGGGGVVMNGVLNGSGGSVTWGTSPTQVTANTSFVKEGSGTVTFVGVQTYSGITVLNGGALQLGASNVVPNTNVIFNGGGINTAGYNESVGTLSLLSDGGTLTLGSGAHELSFSDLGTLDYKMLTIAGWLGTAGSGGTSGVLKVGSSLFFTRMQLDQFKFSYNSGTYRATQLSSGELVPLNNTVTNHANIRITTGATTNGSWSPAYGNNTNGTSYTFTPSANNATINATEIQTILNARYSNVTINTSLNGTTQSGQVDFGVAMNIGWNTSWGGRSLTINANGEVNVSNALTLGNPGSNLSGNITSSSLTVNTVGDINVTATINTKGGNDYANNTTLPHGGAVTLSSSAGVVRASADIITSGAVSTSNASFGGNGGAISITGGGGVSISGVLLSSGRTGSYGAITINDGNSVVTSGGGENDGVSGVITGSTFTKSGAGVLKLSGANAWTGTTTISGGVLQLGSGSNIPDGSAVTMSASGTGIDLNGYSETIGSLTSSSGYGKVTSSSSGSVLLTTGGNNGTTTYKH